MKLKQGDKVRVIAGKDKGKDGLITKVIRSTNKVVVEGINIMKRHQKAQGENPGGIIEFSKPIDASNVMILDPKTKKPTRVGHTVNKDGKKVRVTKKSGTNLD